MYHKPVLIKEVIHEMNPRAGEHFIDCTLGNAGHAIELLKYTAPDGKILAFELDKKAIEEAEARLKEEGFLSRVKIVNDNFRNLKSYAKELPGVNGIFADLGLRSGQLMEGGGGFSFRVDEPLDMRFGKSAEGAGQSRSAAEIVMGYAPGELEDIFKRFGEERNAKGIALAIAEKRRGAEIKTTGELAEIILDFYRRKLKTKKDIPWIGGIHPATRVFQALRIEANDELGALKQLLEDGVAVLSSGGRIGIISYHSLEDRIVKRFYRTSPQLVQATKKPIVPSKEEAQKNRQARSAKFRVAVKK